ncbi:MAG TPA: hypothetical protein VK062_01410 [Burkholderiaceae bacterium]|nr:hypothetical protein [Burkholderiaceae bacterium]
MSVTKISDIVEPEVFTAYIAENTAVKSALVASGVMARNSVILG